MFSIGEQLLHRNVQREMCSGSEAGWYLRLIDFVYHSTLGLRVIKKKKIAGWGRRVPRPNKRAGRDTRREWGISHRKVQRFRGGLVFKAHRLCISLNCRRESNKAEEDLFAANMRAVSL